MADKEESIELGDAENLALSIGVAITEWGKVESELFILYLGLCKALNPPNPSSIVYETLVHIDVKLNAISALIEYTFDPESDPTNEWSKLEGHLRKRIRNVRNKLAHWRIWRDSDESGYFLGPQLTNPERQVKDFGKPTSGAMRADDIYGHSERFAELGDRVRLFNETHVTPSLRGKPRA